MMATWNPWIALLLGVGVGWLFMWILDMLFFRRRNVEMSTHLADATAEAKAYNAGMDSLRQQIQALRSDLDKHLSAVVVTAPSAPELAVAAPEVEARAAGIGLPGVATVAGLGAAATMALRSDEVSVETPEMVAEVPAVVVTAPEIDLPRVEVEASLPAVEVAALAVDVDASGIGPPGVAAVAGLGAAAATALRSDEVSVETPEIVAEVPAVAVEAPEIEAPVVGVEASLPAVEVEAPAVAVETPGIGLPAAAALAGAGVVALREADVDIEPPAVPVVEVPDDFSRIKGIGPKYARLLRLAGINTYVDLETADPEQLRTITNPPAWQRVDFDAWRTQAHELALAPRPVRIGDDFTRLEGIGPKYAAALKENGIVTFSQLAESDESKLAAIVRPPAWQRVVYTEWIEQARLAAAGDEAGLADIQTALFRRQGDKLTLIAGVGEKSAAALKAAGIGSYAALAAATPDQIDDVITKAGLREGDYAAWIAEAELRAAGKRVKRSRRSVSGAITFSPCPQDLSRVPGVGDVYEQKLYAAGIGTYWELASASEADLRAILDIKDFQAIDLAAIRQTASNLAEETGSFGRAWDGSEPDDLASLEGIGETFERRLYEAGICTFAALADSTPERLAEISQAPAWQQVDCAGWIESARARLAAKG